VGAVLLTGCSPDDCYHRRGVPLQEARLHRLREPHLRYADVREKIERLWVGKGGEDNLVDTVTALAALLAEEAATAEESDHGIS